MSASEPPAPGLSTGAVARLLGVSATTVRSWERRYGLGIEREPGRHRRYLPQDVARLEYMCRLTAQGIAPAEAARQCARLGTDREAASEPPARAVPAVRPRAGGGNALPVGRAGAACHGLAKAAVRMDGEAIEELLDASLRRFGVVETWDALAAPVLRAVGRKWAGANGRYVEVEHLLSCAVSRSLHRMPAPVARDPGRAQPRPGLVMLAGTPGELHTLPLEALDAALAQLGIRTLMLGAAVPAEGLVSACTRTGSGAVVLWSQSPPTADTSLLSVMSGLSWGPMGARTGTRVFAAGPGWQGRALPAHVNRLTSLGEATALLCGPA
ncbi:MerR family transcriptional regulator [Streptacidiphilus sp. N1-12]|uniref:MerR family transcriptional regulator n=2 Tax=Streptacidiphilus alkalitolerans TaxID=3342712 RepID=A0ABV6V419_9ACTN